MLYEVITNAFVEREGYGIFGIQQGSVHEDLREESSKASYNFV